MTEGYESLTKIGVWWDLNSCPVPDGVDVSCVRLSIEAAMEKELCCPCRVIMHAVGNLEYISPRHLEEISNSGIILVHAPCGASDLNYLLADQLKFTPDLDILLLISTNDRWFTAYIVRLPHAVARAFPKKDWPSSRPDGCCEVYVWETLLAENKEMEPNRICDSCEQLFESCDDFINHLKSERHIEWMEPTCCCHLCCDDFQSCVDFVEHLKSQEHKDRLFEVVPKDNDGFFGKPILSCKVCNYPGYDEDNMDLHYASDEHKDNVKLAEKKAQEEKLKKKFEKLLRKKLAEKEVRSKKAGSSFV